MPDETQHNPGLPTPPDKSINPLPTQIPPSEPPATPPSSLPSQPPKPASPPPPDIPKIDLLQPQAKEPPGMLKVDIEKDALKKFEIRTMADDLGQPLKAPQGLGSSSFSPPPPPKMTPPSPPKPLSSPLQKYPAPLPPETPEMLFEEEPKRGGMLKSFLLGFIIILLFGGLGLGTWWYLGVNTTSQTPPGPTAVTPPPDNTPPMNSTDASLLPVDKNFTIELGANATRGDLFQKLASHVNTTQDLSSRDIARILLTKDSAPLTLAEFEKLLGVDFSPYVDQKTFTLVYSPQESGATFGLILKATDNEKLAEFFASQEKNIPSFANDIYTSYAGHALPQAATAEFSQNVHQGVAIHYLNFDTPERAFDYAIHQDLLLMGGSRELMFTLVDKANLSSLLGGNK